jgi:hypothetical protein
VQNIKEDESHVPAGAIPLREHGLNAFVPVAGTHASPSKIADSNGPGDRAKPCHARMAEEIQSTAAEAGDGFPMWT